MIAFEESTKEEMQNIQWLFASLAYTDAQFEQLASKFPMTRELYEHCLRICVQDGNMEQYNKLRNSYPEFADDLLSSKSI